MASQTATVQYLRPVASQRCPSRPTWARVAPTYSFTKCEAPEPEAGAEQGAAQKLRHGCSAVPRDSGERSPALLNRFVARGSRLYQHKPCSQERPPPGCSRWLGRPLSSRDNQHRSSSCRHAAALVRRPMLQAHLSAHSFTSSTISSSPHAVEFCAVELCACAMSLPPRPGRGAHTRRAPGFG